MSVEVWHGERALWQITDLFITPLDKRVPPYVLYHRDLGDPNYIVDLKPLPEGLKFKLSLRLAVARPVHDYGTAGDCYFQVITDIVAHDYPPEWEEMAEVILYLWHCGDSENSDHKQIFIIDSQATSTYDWSPHPYFDEWWYILWGRKEYRWEYMQLPPTNMYGEKELNLMVWDSWLHNPEMVDYPELPSSTWDDYVKVKIPIGAPLPPPPSPCFIATATYGTALAPQINVLRRFRDRCLPEKLTRFYYKLSPPLARFIAEHSAVRRFARQLLKLLIGVVKGKS